MTMLTEQSPAPEPPSPRRRPLDALRSRITGQEFVLFGVIALLWTTLGLATDTFIDTGTLSNLAYVVAPIALIGIGMTVVIVGGGIDVSVGSAVTVVTVILAKLVRDQGVSFPVAILVAVGVGGLLGLMNGLLISFGRVHAIIITFGTLNVFRFIALRIFDSEQVAGVPDTLGFLGGGQAGETWHIPHAFLLMLVLAAATWWYMRNTAGGRHFYAMGGDRTAARLAGVKVRRREVLAYVLTGVLVGLAAAVIIGSGGLIGQNVGVGLELQVIAAVVIGGTSIMGGRGTVLGTVLGALLVGTVASGVTILHWPSQLTSLFVGVFILIAVGTDVLRERSRRRA
ncbi:ABC transporter permease [Qaidamihabitans albus]|uniref:ABC transporter permease n=1 Tax=Qaidamihabitans albus TaxID=2795733 RepID=UPI0018F1F452|nr:ABC transporter permease [Qaidamihabitans albus]